MQVYSDRTCNFTLLMSVSVLGSWVSLKDESTFMSSKQNRRPLLRNEENISLNPRNATGVPLCAS